MMRSLIDLAQAWWRCDRIRVRPSEGRLFRLRPGTVLCFSNAPLTAPTRAEVVALRREQHVARPTVCYFCRTSQGEGELLVTSGEGRRPVIDWLSDDESFEVHADDIEVFPAGERK